ncbi:nucleoporin Nup37 [Hyalella azteca]|uniref:Nucleoporin Nup37 n=1 Tax=Hyalella azteca TaxID=294128 RepID=A0A8B7PJ81_HYAAZ|nr:nucleoporin Nup37 [Hyalella azteca]
MEVSVEPTLSVSTNSEILCVEFSPYEWSKNLIAVALTNAINIYSVQLQEEKENGETECKLLCESQVEGECMHMAWSPSTSLHSSPPSLKLLLATNDDVIIEFTTDLKSSFEKELFRHSNCINSLACSGISSTSLLPTLWASVGDDQLLRVWSEPEERSDNASETALENSAEASLVSGWSESITLLEPGQSVKFHPEDSSLVLVCEVSGTLRLYRITPSEEDSCQLVVTAEWSVRCPAPLLDADWSLVDPDLIMAACSAGVALINVSSNGSARKSMLVLSGSHKNSLSSGYGGGRGAVKVRGARNSPALVAAVTASNSVTVLHATASRIPLTAHLKAVGGISWHLELPYLSVGSDRRLLLWRVDKIS